MDQVTNRDQIVSNQRYQQNNNELRTKIDNQSIVQQYKALRRQQKQFLFSINLSNDLKYQIFQNYNYEKSSNNYNSNSRTVSKNRENNVRSDNNFQTQKKQRAYKNLQNTSEKDLQTSIKQKLIQKQKEKIENAASRGRAYKQFDQTQKLVVVLDPFRGRLIMKKKEWLIIQKQKQEQTRLIQFKMIEQRLNQELRMNKLKQKIINESKFKKQYKQQSEDKQHDKSKQQNNFFLSSLFGKLINRQDDQSNVKSRQKTRQERKKQKARDYRNQIHEEKSKINANQYMNQNIKQQIDRHSNVERKNKIQGFNPYIYEDIQKNSNSIRQTQKLISEEKLSKEQKQRQKMRQILKQKQKYKRQTNNSTNKQRFNQRGNRLGEQAFEDMRKRKQPEVKGNYKQNAFKQRNPIGQLMQEVVNKNRNSENKYQNQSNISSIRRQQLNQSKQSRSKIDGQSLEYILQSKPKPK